MSAPPTTASVDARRPRRTYSVWIDIENPPQVQYLVPLVHAFHERGAQVTVSARDYGIALDLLRQQDIAFHPIGRHFGASKLAKVAGNLRRTAVLAHRMKRIGRPDVVVSASRSAALAARLLRIPSFVLCDYEYVNLAAFRVSRSYVVHPDVIDPEKFQARGVDANRLVSFHGIKEDLSFAYIDLDAVRPADLPSGPDGDRLRILMRPPAEESHYHRGESTVFARNVLAHFAARDDCTFYFSPRYDWQQMSLDEHDWRIPPVVLTRPLPFVSLLKAVDLVISGGGTMTREAAYLGIPAISIFQGAASQVDEFLESEGRLMIVREPDALEHIELANFHRRRPLRRNPDAAHEIAATIESIAPTRRTR